MTLPRTQGRPPGQTGAALLATARAAFLENGYSATTMDQVASRAHISKSSLYREHLSKSALYAAVVSDWAESGRDAMGPSLDRLAEDPDVERGLTTLAEALLQGVLSPEVVEMRRLVINEAKAQPEIAALYLRESWQRNIDALASTLDALRHTRNLRIDDARLAAEEFTWLLVGGALNEALLGAAPRIETNRSGHAIAAFLTLYSR